MARFIVASRHTGTESEITNTVHALGLLHAKVGRGHHAAAVDEDPSRVQILEGNARDFHAKRAELAEHLIIEQEVQRSLGVTPPQSSLPPGLGSAIELDLSSEGSPLEDALAVLYLQSSRGAPPTTAVANADAAGHVVLPYDASMWFPVCASVVPRSGAWSVMSQITSPRVQLSLPALPRTGPLAWWHRALGVNDYNPRLGEGIRVGVIDTGIGPHPYLEHAKRAGAFINGTVDTSPGATDAVADHGTHVAGIIGARPTDLSDFAGISPGVDLVIARVYPGGGPPGMESGPTNNADVAQAILALSRDEECDIINISSSGLLGSEIESNRITAAAGLGTLVICSVGNGGGPPVMFPAADPSAVGVTAIGLINATPFGVLDSMSVPQTPDRYAQGGIYSPTFTSLGMEVKCAAPGVGIISTIPPFGVNKAPYAAMSGTSMAAPALAAALAVALSRDSKYKSLPRSSERSSRAGALLTRSLCSLGLMIPYQGFGLPYLTKQ